MANNEGTIDRSVRIILGIALLTLTVIPGTAWGWLGLFPLITGIIGFCPIYRLLGASTAKRPPAFT